PGLLHTQSDTVMDAQALTKRYGSGHTEVLAVNSLNLTVRRGDITLIMGPSGSGKTSLLLLLGCLMQPTTGTLHFLGTNVTQLAQKQLAAFRLLQLGFVFQNFNLLESLSAQENVEIPMHLAGIKSATMRERSATLLANLGLEKRAKHGPKQLSGGEKQRVAIARAMALGPSLILADEPTANLDSKSGQIVMESFQQVARAERCSVVIVSHDPRVREISDRILWLEDGTLHDTSSNGKGIALDALVPAGVH
ncbi:MAG TPA: ABC transporter ATP-binding protein, partial [Herpetosiphonaceae bacterium]